jgi:hypothetical protein
MFTLPRFDVTHGQSVIICLLAFILASYFVKILHTRLGVGGDCFRRRRRYLTSASCSGKEWPCCHPLLGRVFGLHVQKRVMPLPLARPGRKVPCQFQLLQLLMHIARSMNPGTHPWVHLTSSRIWCRTALARSRDFLFSNVHQLHQDYCR